MSRHFSTAICVASTVVALLSTPVAAQTIAGGTLNCSGKAVLHPKPTILRLQLHLFGGGENLEAILKALDDSGVKYRKALLAAHANADSVKISSPTLPNGLPGMDSLAGSSGLALDAA